MALVGMAMPLAGAWGQVTPPSAAAGGRDVVLVPSLTVTETLTTNVLLDDANRRTDAVTALSAGVSLLMRGSRVQGTLDYQLSGSIHARESQTNAVARTLRAAGTAEVVDDWFFVNVDAQIGQQTISAFGLQSTDPAFKNSNRTEVRSLVITPQVRGRIGSFATYTGQYSQSVQRSADGSAGDLSGSNASFNISSTTGLGLGWGVSAARQQSSFEGGRDTATESLRGTLRYAPSLDLRLSVSGGKERSDVLDQRGSSSDVWGVGAEWTPSARTRLLIQRDHRFLGDTHTLSFDHRMARTLWRFTSSKDLTTAQPAFVNTGTISYYDLLFANLAAQEPDPVLRREKVLQELARQGLDPLQTAGSTGFLNSALTLTKRHDLSVAYQGLRTNLTLAIYRSDSRRLDLAAQVIDDLTQSAFVRLSGATLTVSHQLTPTAALNLNFLRQENRGSSAQLGTELQSINLTWVSQIGRRAELSLGGRYVDFDSRTVPSYIETALFATFRARF